jgi:hypothetical protein
MHGLDRFAGGPGATADACRALFRISRALRARVCSILATDADGITSEDIRLIMQPVIADGIDLVLSCYPRRRFEGLISTGIVYPLTRALYGRRIHCPLNPVLGFSGPLMDRALEETPAGTIRGGGTVWIPAYAVRYGFQVGEVHLTGKPPAPRDPADLSTVMSEVVGAVYAGMEQNAAFWQRTRGSQPVPAWGRQQTISDEAGDVDASGMIEAFRLGYTNLLDVWGLFLPPATLVELKRLTRTTPDRFRLPDEVWARIVYDFGLGYRLRTISRDHLLRAMTPLYLGWVASWASEVRELEPHAVEERLERLCTVYETQKPYLLSRWRWPDRFNP